LFKYIFQLFYQCIYGSLVSGASEILKIAPFDGNTEIFAYAETINEQALENNEIKHNKAIYHRMDLADAISSFHTHSVCI